MATEGLSLALHSIATAVEKVRNRFRMVRIWNISHAKDEVLVIEEKEDRKATSFRGSIDR